MLVSFEELKAVTKTKNKAALVALLSRQGIRFFLGNNNEPWTTLDALNIALGIKPQTQPITAPTLDIKIK